MNWSFFGNSPRTGLLPITRRFERKSRLATYRRSKMTKKLSNLSEAILEMAGDQLHSGLAQRFQHLRPHLGVALFVLLQFFRANLQQNTNTHKSPSSTCNFFAG